MYGADAPHTVEYQIYRGEATAIALLAAAMGRFPTIAWGGGSMIKKILLYRFPYVIQYMGG